MKTYNANIWCAFPGCHAEPYPDDPTTTRETFSLLRLGPNGRPASPGEWRCEAHPIPEQDLPAKRAPRVTPAAALTDFGNVLETELGYLREEIANGDHGEAVSALVAFRQEIERGFAALRKAVQQ